MQTPTPDKQKIYNQKLNFSMQINESSTINNEFMIKGTAINAVTTRNGHTFLAEELSISASSLKGRPLLKDHTNTIDSIIGKVIDAFYEPMSQSIKFTASIFDESIKQKIKAGLINSVSVGANVKDIEEGENGDVIVKGIEFVELSLVAVPADPNAGFAMAIMQSLSTGNDVKQTLEQSKGIPKAEEKQEITQEKMVETKVEEKAATIDTSKIEKLMESLMAQNIALTEKITKLEESKKVEEAKEVVKVNETKGKVAISEEVEKEFENFVLERANSGYALYANSFGANSRLSRGNN